MEHKHSNATVHLLVVLVILLSAYILWGQRHMMVRPAPAPAQTAVIEDHSAPDGSVAHNDPSNTYTYMAAPAYSASTQKVGNGGCPGCGDVSFVILTKITTEVPQSEITLALYKNGSDAVLDYMVGDAHKTANSLPVEMINGYKAYHTKDAYFFLFDDGKGLKVDFPDIPSTDPELQTLLKSIKRI